MPERLRCTVPSCKRSMIEPPGEFIVEWICDEHFILASERQRDAYLRADPSDERAVNRAWQRVKRTILQRAARSAA